MQRTTQHICIALSLLLYACSEPGKILLPLFKDQVASPDQSALLLAAPPPRRAGESVRAYLQRVAPKISDKEVDRHIEGAIRSENKRVIRGVMLRLPTYARENVIYVDSGLRVFANKKVLLSTTDVGIPVAGKPGMFEYPDGRLSVGPPVTAKAGTLGSAALIHAMYGVPPASSSTGPYRRVYSDPGVWTAAGMHVDIADHATSLNSKGPYGDTGFMYAGGWSASGSDSADGGLQYSAERNVANAFLSIQSTRAGEVTNGAHDYAPNQDIEIEFEIGCGTCDVGGGPGPYLAVFVWGSWTSGGYGGTTIVERPVNINDWRANGTVLKAMISLAQSKVGGLRGGVAYDGYQFGYVGVDYCGWQGPNFNRCFSWQNTNGYHNEQYIPNNNVVHTVAPGYMGYDEAVAINLSSSPSQASFKALAGR